MSYYSTFSYEFSSDIEIVNLGELNKKVTELKYDMAESVITEKEDGGYYITTQSQSHGEFYDSEDFAKLMSRYIGKGHLDTIYCGEDGETSGYRIRPNNIKELTMNFTVKED